MELNFSIGKLHFEIRGWYEQMKAEVEQDEVRCNKCGWVWLPRSTNPKMCANQKCRTPYWKEERDKYGNIIKDNR